MPRKSQPKKKPRARKKAAPKPQQTDEIVSRADLARMANKSRSAVTQACRPGGALYPAVVPGKGVKFRHPATEAWLAGGQPGIRSPEHAELLLAKRRAEIRRLELANQEIEGRLISRELVQVHVFGLIEASHKRLLGEASATIAHRLYGAARSDIALEDAEQLVRDLISSQLRHAKDAATRLLTDAD